MAEHTGRSPQCEFRFKNSRCGLEVDHPTGHVPWEAHEHTWKHADEPVDGINEYRCVCGAEKQVMHEDDADGTTTVITIWEPSRED
jgi:hypothetical protein